MQQLRGTALLEHIPRGAGAHQLLQIAVVGMPGEREDLGSRAPSVSCTVAARPFSPGMEMSMITTSGVMRSACETASRPRLQWRLPACQVVH